MIETTKGDRELLDAAVEKAGGSYAALARAFGLQPNAVKQWPRRGVPRHLRPRLETYVNGSTAPELVGDARVEHAVLEVLEALRQELGEDSPKWAGVSRAALEILKKLEKIT